jgi:hypothetical protein
MPGRSYQTKPGLSSGCQVYIKCFYAKSTCLGSNYRNISSLTLVQKVIPVYLQRTVDNYSRAYLWLISHDLSHGVPLMFQKNFSQTNSCFIVYLLIRGRDLTHSTSTPQQTTSSAHIFSKTKAWIGKYLKKSCSY